MRGEDDGVSCRCWGGRVRRRRSPRRVHGHGANSGELLATILCKARRECERTVAVMSDRGSERGKGERDRQHGHQLAVAHLGQRRRSEDDAGWQPPSGSNSALLAVHERERSGGEWSGEAGWSGAVEFVLGAALLNSRAPAHGGLGAGAVQQPHGLAVGVVWRWLWCWAIEGAQIGRAHV